MIGHQNAFINKENELHEENSKRATEMQSRSQVIKF